MKRWLRCLSYAFFPRRCIYCDTVIAPDDTACGACAEQIPRMEGICCPRCGRTKSMCMCRKRRHAFETCIAAMRYEAGAKRAVRRLKTDRSSDLVRTMAEEMVRALRARTDAAPLEAVTFVPMTARDLRRREYNQSAALAAEVATLLELPCKPLLKKLYETRKQKELPMIERSGNVLGVFDVQAPLTDRRILLVDDLITTGATLHECAKMLKIYGAETVTVLTFAASIPQTAQTSNTDP